MFKYILQVILICCLLVVFARTKYGLDKFLIIYSLIWSLSVIAIFYRYGTAQDLFYSNDQKTLGDQVHVMAQFGVDVSPSALLNKRYAVALPAFFLTIFGLNTVLALKAVQATYFVFSYRLVQTYFRNSGLKLRPAYLMLFSGPLFVFLSLLGLRDIALSFFAVLTLIGGNHAKKALGFIGVFLLRPHLAVALALGYMATLLLFKLRFRSQHLWLTAFSVFSFVCGGYLYVIGLNTQYGLSIGLSKPISFFSLGLFTEFLANFVGLQFLLAKFGVINQSIRNLFVLRIIFFESVLIPILFIWQTFKDSVLDRRLVFVLLSFSFFMGLVLQTDFNSTRQNLPFFALMGILVAERFAVKRRDTSNIKSITPTLVINLNQKS